ncbi:hypothetical protein GW17_00028329 [Ensete ventricosum]|nr:hypothetical protein GW17_00028329 [Ensete ventricosum]
MLGDKHRHASPPIGRGSYGAAGRTPPDVGFGLEGSGKPPREVVRLQSRMPGCTVTPFTGVLVDEPSNAPAGVGSVWRSVPESVSGRSGDMGPPSSAKMIKTILVLA